MNQEKAQILADRATHLTAIKNSPSWPTVKATMEDKIDSQLKLFLGQNSLTDAALHYGRGYIQGMRVMLLMVEGGEKEFEKAIQTAQALEQSEVSQ